MKTEKKSMTLGQQITTSGWLVQARQAASELPIRIGWFANVCIVHAVDPNIWPFQKEPWLINGSKGPTCLNRPISLQPQSRRQFRKSGAESWETQQSTVYVDPFYKYPTTPIYPSLLFLGGIRGCRFLANIIVFSRFPGPIFFRFLGSHGQNFWPLRLRLLPYQIGCGKMQKGPWPSRLKNTMRRCSKVVCIYVGIWVSEHKAFRWIYYDGN